jgi:hypothetical protein
MNTRKPPRRLFKRHRDPLDGSMGMVLFGRPEDLRGKTTLLVVPRVGEVRRLPPGYETADCADCGSAVWVNSGFMESARRRGSNVAVTCSTCSLGGPFERPR